MTTTPAPLTTEFADGTVMIDGDARSAFVMPTLPPGTYEARCYVVPNRYQIGDRPDRMLRGGFDKAAAVAAAVAFVAG